MKTTLKIWTLIVFTVLACACETVVDIELPESESKLVANAIFNDENNIQVSTSASKGIMVAGDLESVTTAEVTITGSDGTMASTKSLTVNPITNKEIYQLPFAAKPGVKYKLTVSAPGYETVTSESSLPAKTKILAVDTLTTVEDGFETSQMAITFQDEANESNYYEIALHALVFVPDTFENLIVFTAYRQELYSFPASVDDFFNDKGDELIFTDELFDGREVTQLVNYNYNLPFIPIDSTSEDPSLDIFQLLSTYVIVELRTLSEDLFQFQTTYTTYRFTQGDPFAQPVQVYNNVEGGFGIFAGYSSSYDTLRFSKGLLPSPLDF